MKIRGNDRLNRIAMLVLSLFMVAGLVFIDAKSGHVGKIVFNVATMAVLIFSLFWQLRIIKKNPDKPILRLKSNSPFWRILMALAIVGVVCKFAVVYSDYAAAGKFDLGTLEGIVIAIGLPIWMGYLLHLQKKQENRH
jgi:hypothetical protein